MTEQQYEVANAKAEAATQAAWQAIIDKLAVIKSENDADVRATHCSELLGLLHVHSSARRYQTRLMWQMRADRLLGKIVAAIDDEGPQPNHHRFTMSRHRVEWPTLWKALDAARHYFKHERNGE
jgi:hypothetical protein